MNRLANEMNYRTEATLDDLPELPFEKVLSYLSLRDVIKIRAVSKRCKIVVDGFRVKSLCFSPRPIGFLLGKSRWVSGAFAQNFICSPRYEQLNGAFGQTILSSLKRLRLCSLRLDAEKDPVFVEILQSFNRLEQLDMFDSRHTSQFELNLPTLRRIELERFEAKKLKLTAPKLVDVKVWNKCSLILELVHGESVESLVICDMKSLEVKELKKLKKLYIGFRSNINDHLLKSMKHLKEVNVNTPEDVEKLFAYKTSSKNPNLEIFYCSLRLEDPRDPVTRSKEVFYRHLIQSPSRIAPEMPLCRCVRYWPVECLTLGSEVGVLKKFIDLIEIHVDKPIKQIQEIPTGENEETSEIDGIQRFLNILRDFPNIVFLNFSSEQPQGLFDRLSEHCAVQKLVIASAPPDLEFLFKLQQLIHLELLWPVDAKFIRRALRELPFLCQFNFKCNNRTGIRIWIANSNALLIDFERFPTWTFFDLNSAILFLADHNVLQKKRKAEQIESTAV